MLKQQGEAWLRSRHKRAMDLGIVGLFSAPALSAAGLSALALAVEMQRKPWFLQPRIGRHEDELFILPKLVTLRGAIDSLPSVGGHNNERASQIGKIVRKLHIDEALQLPLIASGKMSAVGPRPVVPVEHQQVMDILSPAEQREYLAANYVCKPGIVTLNSDLQHRDRGISPYERAMTTIEYARTASAELDTSLLLLTTGSLLKSIADYK